MITDGNDNASLTTLDHLRTIADQHDIAVYATGLMNEQEPHAGRTRRELTDLTEATGGLAYFPTSLEQIDDVALEMARQIRMQYTIGYTPLNQALDGSFRRIRVTARGSSPLQRPDQNRLSRKSVVLSMDRSQLPRTSSRRYSMSSYDDDAARLYSCPSQLKTARGAGRTFAVFPLMNILKVVAIATVTVLVGTATADAQARGRARGNGVVVGRAVPRGGVRSAPRVVAGSRVVRVAPVRFYQPYYTFRPRLNLGFGLWLGYPVAYTLYYGYYNPSPLQPVPPVRVSVSSGTVSTVSVAGVPERAYPPPPYPPAAYPPASYPPSAYPPPASYPQSPYPPSSYQQGSVAAQPSQPTGGMSFEITPADAQLYVDGQNVGTVGQFTPTSQPLGLTAGRHHIQITAPGYRTMELDANIIAGEVLPYQGTLGR